MDKYFKIIPDGPYKDKRLYFEGQCGPQHIFPTELYYLFQHSMKVNYDVYYFICESNHNINFDKLDLQYIQTTRKTPFYETYIKHDFSENTLKIKNMQHYDMLKIYDLAIKSDQIGAFFTYPIFDKNKKYCFNMFLVVKSGFDINVILNIDFKLIKIISVIKYTPHTLTLKLIQNMYNLIDVVFKDYIIDGEEEKKTRPFDEYKLPEEINWNNFIDNLWELEKNNPGVDFSELNKQKDLLREKIYVKKAELINWTLLKKLFFEKICWQFYIFHKVVGEDTGFYTNYYQLIGANVISIKNDLYGIDYEHLSPYSLDDLFDNDEYFLFSVNHNVWQWRKK